MHILKAASRLTLIQSAWDQFAAFFTDTDTSERQEMAEELQYRLRKDGIPAVVNHVDYSLGLKHELGLVLRVLRKLGYSGGEGNSADTYGKPIKLVKGARTILVTRPRSGWTTIIQILN